jgi:hypothetical protein
MLMRAGQDHPVDGNSFEPGDLAVLCPACPQPGKNLPDDWENAPEEKRLVLVISMPSLLIFCQAGYTLFS